MMMLPGGLGVGTPNITSSSRYPRSPGPGGSRHHGRPSLGSATNYTSGEDEMVNIRLEDWWPMPPDRGPPLPRFMGVIWPWYKPPGAEFKVSDLVISHTEVQVGYPVSISCLVTNIGAEAGDYTARLGGDFVTEQVVTLQPGESKTISFEVTPTIAKTYSVSVDGLTGSFVATEVPVADIRVENLTITPKEVMVGEPVSISVVAKNYGTAAGSKTIVVTVS